MNPHSHPNGAQPDASKPPFDAEGLLKIMQDRSDIIDTDQNCGLAQSLGVMLTADHVDDTLKELLEGQNPRALMYKGEKIPPNFSPRGAISWDQLIAQVPVQNFRDIGDIERTSTLGLLYQCEIDGYRVEITAKARKLIELLQLTHRFSPSLSRSHNAESERFFADDFKKEADIALKEAANADEAVKYAIYIQKSATEYREKMLQHAERHRKLAYEISHISDTNYEEASGQEPAQEPDISDSESDINSILNDPTGDIPYRSPSSQRDGNFDKPMEEDQRPNGHTQHSLASFNRSFLASQDSPASSEGSTDGNDSDIPQAFRTSKGRVVIPPTEEEKRDAEEFVATGRLAGLDWGKISHSYTRRFRIRRTTQYWSTDTLSIGMCLSRGGNLSLSIQNVNSIICSKVLAQKHLKAG